MGLFDETEGGGVMIELENSMLLPTVHDERYDDRPALGFEDEDEDEEVFEDDDIDEF